jgi:hypothetical protein
MGLEQRNLELAQLGVALAHAHAGMEQPILELEL